MSGLNHAWDSDDKRNHADFIHGAVGVDDFYKEVNYAPRKKKKGCKKGNGQPCLFTKKVVRHQWYIKRDELWSIHTTMVCERCGKVDWTTYSFRYSKTLIN